MSITLKVLNAKTEVASYKVENGATLTIQAQDNVNYQLIDDTTGYAPQNLIAKRVGNDLQVMLENGDMVPDIIIEDYYGDEDPAAVTNLLVGQHESGKMYAYVPESGETSDAVSMLAEQVAAPQALGGDEITGLWVFSPWWLLALLPLAALIPRDGGNKAAPDTAAPHSPDVDAKDDGSVVITPPSDADTKTIDITYTKPDGTVTATKVVKGDDGKWTTTDPDVTVDPTTGVVTIPEDKVKDGTEVKSTATDTSGNTSAPDSDIAKDVTAPTQPDVKANDDGSVTITPPTDADTKTIDITYTKPDGTTTTTTVSKDTDGKWTSTDQDVTVDPTTGVVTIPEDKVKDGTEVKSTATDTSGNTSAPDSDIAKDVTAPTQPDVKANDDGSVTITPPTDADTKTIDITYTKPDGTTTTTTISKDADGKWTTTDPDVTVDPTTGVVTIPEDKVKDGTEVKATATDTSGNTSAPDSDIAKDVTAPTQPDVKANDDGSVTITRPSDADTKSVDIAYTKPDGTTTTTTVSKDTDGKWTSTDPDVTVDPTTGVVTIPEDKVKDGTEVKATATDTSGNTSAPDSDIAKDVTAPTQPDVKANDDGSVTITPPTDADTKTVDITYTKPDGTTTTTTISKDTDGKWTTTDPDVTVDPTTGVVTIPEDKVKDDTEVKATATDISGNTSAPDSDIAKDVTASSKPTVEILDGGDGKLNKAEIDAGVQVKVTPPADAKPGDVLNVDTNGDGKPDYSKTLTADDISNGVTVAVPAAHVPSEGTLTVSATVTDPAGNVSEPGSDSAATDANVPNGGEKPTVEITEDKNNDGYINREELQGDVDVKVSFDGSKVSVGDVVTIVSGDVTKTVTITDADKANGFVTTSFTAPADGSTMTVTSTISDAAGNQTPEGEDSAVLDLSNLTQPGVTVEITEDANNDGFINKAELDGTVGVKVGLPTAAVAGDLLVVTATGNAQQSIELTQAMIDAKSVTVEFNPLPDGSKMDVTAKVTDKAGNASNVATDSATFALSEPGAPVVTIKLDADNDGFINAKEKGDATTTDVEIKISADAKDGDVITVTDQAGNVLATYTVGQNGVTAGSTQTTQASLPADGETLKVTASVKDAAGNPGASGSDSAKMDTTVFEGLAVEITEDANNDGYISAAELQGAVDVRVTLPKGAAVGDVLTVTGSGNVDQNFTLTQAQLDQGYIDVAFGTAPVNNTDFKATATIKDTAGNTAGPVEDKAKVLLQASGAPTVTITEDANNDGLISKAELEGEIGVSVTLPAGAKAGDTLIVTPSNGTPIEITLTAADISKGSVPVSGVVSPGEGNTLTVTAQVKDAAGNLSPEGKDSATIDTTAPSKPTVEILDGGDGKLNKAEIDAGVQVKVTPPADAKPGDVLNVDTNGDGKPDYSKTLTADDISNGVTVAVPAAHVPSEGTLTVSATVTDPAGNVSEPGSDSAATDANVPNGGEKPTVEITEDKNNDGYINREELQGDVDVKVSFDGSKVSVGDVVTIVSGDVTKTVTITDADKANGFVTTSFTAPADGSTMTVTSTISDAAGNQTPEGEDSAVLDLSNLTQPGVTVEITEDANNDGFINKAELDGTVGVKVGLPTAAVAGDLLVVTATGNAQQSIELTQAMIDAKSVTVEFNPLPDGSKMDVTAKVTDKAGNASNVATDSATFALSEPGAPGVTIKLDTDNDGFINAKEKGSATTTDVEIKISADAKDGDVITVTDQAGNVLATYTVGQNGVTAGSTQTTQASLPADGETLKVTASVKDAAGNPGASGSDSAKMDTTVFEGLAVEITEDANNDGYISAAELQGAVDVRVTLPKGAAVGDVLTVTGSGNVDQNFTLTQAQLDQGYIDVAFGTAPVNNTDFKATATIKDTAGNTAGPVEDKAKVLLQASGAPTVTITEDANNDGLISKAELEGEIGVSITLPAGAKAGDTLLVSANGTVLTPIMLTAADISKGSVSVPGIVSPGEGNTLTVTAQVKDAAGNLSPEGKDSAVIDTTAPNAPAVKILDGGDELLNSSEVAAGVKAEISLADTGAVKGDVLNVDTNGDGVIDRTITLTEEQITAGKVIVDVPAAQVPANGILTVKASITDIAGNPGQTGSDTSVVDTTAPTIDIQAIAGESQNPLGTDADSYATINIKDKSDGFAVSGVTNAEDGQVVTVKVYDGTTEVSSITTTVTNGTWSANVPAGATWIADTKVYKFEATVADKAGNTNSDEDLTKATDLVAPDNSTTTLKIDSITTDNILNAAEAKTNINVTGTVSGDEFKAGDTVTLTVNGKDFSGEVDKDGKFTIAVPGSDLAADDDTTVAGKVEVTDAAGNTGTATATQKYGVDITAPTIDIQTIAGESQSPLTTDADNYATINLKDKTDGFKVSGTTDAEDGQVVTIKVNNGTADVASFTATVTGGIWSADVPANESWVTDGTVYSFTASVADKAGNTATDTDKTAATDITPPNKDTTTLTITSVAGDDVVNKTESTAAEVPVVGKVTGEFKVDDIVTLKVNNVEYTGKVTADGSFTINVKGADLLADGDKVVDASITTTDAAGNSGTIETTHQYKVDTSVAIDINQIAGENQVTEGTDGYATINLKDKTDSFKVSGTTDAEDGQVVTIKVNNGTADVASFTATVTGGTWSADVPANESWVTDGTVYSFTASVADKAGNTATDTDKTAATDITPPNKDTTTLTITSVAGDDVVNKTESTSTEVPVVGKVTGEFKVDDIVTLKVNNVDYTGKVAADGSFTINVKGADLLADGDKMVDASITTTDAAGNSGTIETTHQYKVDTSVAIDINQIAGENQVAEGTDGYATINQKDKTDGFKVSGTTDAEDGQIVTVTVTAEGSTTVLGSFTATVATGAWSVDVPKAAAWITDGTVYSFTASVSDKAGNTATDIDKTVATDLTAPTIDIQTIANESQAPLATDADGYATINIKDKADGFAVSGVTTAEVGQTVTVTVLKDGVAVDGVNLTATVTATGSWSAAVPANADWIVDKAVYSFVATVADKAGNTASDTDVTKATDLVAPDNSTTTLTIDSITADNVLNAAEAKTSINVTGTVSGNEFKAGDKVTLTVNGKDFTGTVDANGKFSIAVPGSDLAADNDTTVAGKVEVTDAAGNVGTATANREYGIDITAPTIDINHIAGESQVTEGTDNYAVITKADAQAGFVISGVTTGVEDGQKVSIYILDANGSVALQSYVGVATVTGNKWSYSVGANQIPGGAAYTIKAEVSDVAGNLDSDTDKTAVPPPTLAASAVAVSEEGLTNVSALPDNLGLAGADTTNFAKASGTMAVTDATSVVFSATGQPTTLGGTAVTWTGTGTQTLTAKDSSGATVLTATIDNHGDYVVTLNSAIKHPVNGTTPATSEDAVNVVLKATATGAGGSTTADLTVSIEDDSPTSGKTINLSSGLPQQDTNLIFVVDLTTTMDERDVNTPDTRIEMAKTALSALLDVYAGMGNVKVTLIGYRDKYAETLQTWTDASTMKTKWMTVGSAGLDTFDVSTSTGLTGYTAIPAETSTAWSKAGKITSSTNPIKNVAYVFTDGDVTGDSLTSTQVNTWVNFLKTNSITSNAYAVGTETASINLTEMGKLAYDGATSTDTNAVRVPNMNDLKGVLLASATPPISGSLLDPTPDVDGNAMISAGADGFGSVTSIVVDGKTYTYNKDTDTPSANTSSIASFNNITKAWTITYTTGAVLTVDMDDATYSYKIGTNTPAAGDKFSFTMADKDGDKGTNTFSFFKNKIDINSIAGEDQGTTDKDLYATISAADIAAGVAVKGITYDIPSGKAVTITVKDASEATVGTLSATVASDGTWSATAPANATWLKANTYYSFTASVTDSSGTAYTDKDVVNYAAQVKSVDSVTVTEGAYLEHLVTLSAGSMPTTATVKLTAGSATLDADLLQGASSGTVQVQYSLDGGIKWTTQSVAVTSGVAQFDVAVPAYASSFLVSTKSVADTLNEGAETYTVSVTTGSATQSGTGTINNLPATQTLEGNAVTEGGLLDLRRADNGMDNTTGTKSDTDGKTNNWLNEFVVTTDIANSGGVTIRTEPGLGFTETNSPLTGGLFTGTNPTGMLAVFSDYENPALGITSTQYQQNAAEGGQLRKLMLVKEEAVRVVQGETLELNFDAKTINADKANAINVQFVLLDSTGKTVSQTGWYSTDGQSVSYYDGMGTVSKVLGKEDGATVIGTDWGMQSAKFDTSTLATGDYQLGINYSTNQVALQVSTADRPSDPAARDLLIDRIALSDATITGTDNAEMLIGFDNSGATKLATKIYAQGGDDFISISNTMIEKIDGGAGKDTLQLSAPGLTLDLTQQPQDVIKNIEVVDLSASGNQTLKLTYQDLLDMSGNGSLQVDGKAGDGVQISNGAVAVTATTQEIHGITYNAYNLGGSSEADLLVQQGVTVSFVL